MNSIGTADTKDENVSHLEELAQSMAPNSDEEKITVFETVVSKPTDLQQREIERYKKRIAELEQTILNMTTPYEIGRYTPGMIHGFKSILCVITGYSQLTSECIQNHKKEPEKIEELFEKIEKAYDVIIDASTRMYHQVEDVMKYSRSGQNEKTEKSIFTVEGFINEELKMIDPKADDVEKKYDENKKSVTLFNKDALRLAFVAILENALQASKEKTYTFVDRKKPVTIDIVNTKEEKERIGIEEKYLAIRIKDSGFGISDEIKPKLFTFGATFKENGNGIGLYFAKHMMEKFGGRIGNNTKHGIKNEGTGTTFYIMVPHQNENLEVNDNKPMPN